MLKLKAVIITSSESYSSLTLKEYEIAFGDVPLLSRMLHRPSK